MTGHEHRISVAPMMDWTDRHCRSFHRVLTRHAWLYTEMVTSAALLHGDPERLLAFDPGEQPLALQLGGSDPDAMAEGAALAEQFGYREVNINVGCPSDRVQSGRFGACLMAEPRLVAECFERMQARVSIPVTVKTRIGIDDSDSYEFLTDFVRTLAAAGCRLLVLHARKAILSGLSPKENRSVPPLKYDTVYRIKQDFPDLTVVLNGGVGSHRDIARHLRHVDGVMLGRVAYQDPYILAEVDRLYYGDAAPPASRPEVVERYLPYVAGQLHQGVRLHAITRHMLGLFAGQAGARAWRRVLSEQANRPGAGMAVLEQALQQIVDAQAA